MFSPYQVIHQNKWYKLFSHAFIHADWTHLIFNMYTLYIFGRFIEAFFNKHYELGNIYYLLLYFGGALFACVPSMIKHKNNDLYFSLGASGAVSAVIFATIIIRPDLQFFFGIPAVIFGPLYLLYEFLMSKRSQSRIAHDAHFAGAVFGIIFTLMLDFNYFINNFIIQVKLLMNS